MRSAIASKSAVVIPARSSRCRVSRTSTRTPPACRILAISSGRLMVTSRPRAGMPISAHRLAHAQRLEDTARDLVDGPSPVDLRNLTRPLVMLDHLEHGRDLLRETRADHLRLVIVTLDER